MSHIIKVLFLATLVSLSACTKKDKNKDTGGEDILKIGIDSEPPSMDWNKATDTTSSFISRNIMTGLVNFDLEDPELTLSPSLAESWTPNKEATVWTFKIRKDVKWSDGKPFSAQNVVDSWVRLLTPETASQYAYFLYGIKNAQAFNSGKIKDPSKLGLKITDEGDLEVTLEGPMAFFPQLLTHSSTYPVRLDVIKKHGDQWTEPGKIVTLGPYNMTSWQHDKEIIFERNPNYFGSPAKLEKIKIIMISDINTQINLFKSGALDVLRRLPTLQLAFLRQRPDYRKTPILGIYYLGYNTKKKPMDNVKVRQAITMGINRDEIVQMLNAGHHPLNGWVPKGMFGYDESLGYKFDVAAANKLLDEAGYKDRSKFPKLTYSYNTNENHKRVAENVQSQLKKNLGINVEIRNEEWKVYLNSLQTDPAHIFRMGWLADYPDPDNFLNFMISDSDNNHTGWGSKEFDKMIETGAKTLDKEKRRDLYNQAQKLLVEKAIAVFPVYSMVSNKLVSERVKNYPLNSMDQQPLSKVELLKKN